MIFSNVLFVNHAISKDLEEASIVLGQIFAEEIKKNYFKEITEDKQIFLKVFD